MPKAPRSLLRNVCWSFTEPVPGSPAELIEAARTYAADIEAHDRTKELVQVLPFYDVRLVYEHAIRVPSGDWQEVEAEVRVACAPLARLTGADLLWELHVACASTVGENDHHFFEGFELEAEGTELQPPTYRVILGS